MDNVFISERKMDFPPFVNGAYINDFPKLTGFGVRKVTILTHSQRSIGQYMHRFLYNDFYFIDRFLLVNSLELIIIIIIIIIFRKLEVTCHLLLFSLRNSTLTSQIWKKEKIISHTTGTRTRDLGVSCQHDASQIWIDRRRIDLPSLWIRVIL